MSIFRRMAERAKNPFRPSDARWVNTPIEVDQIKGLGPVVEGTNHQQAKVFQQANIAAAKLHGKKLKTQKHDGGQMISREVTLDIISQRQEEAAARLTVVETNADKYEAENLPNLGLERGINKTGYIFAKWFMRLGEGMSMFLAYQVRNATPGETLVVAFTAAFALIYLAEFMAKIVKDAAIGHKAYDWSSRILLTLGVIAAGGIFWVAARMQTEYFILTSGDSAPDLGVVIFLISAMAVFVGSFVVEYKWHNPIANENDRLHKAKRRQYRFMILWDFLLARARRRYELSRWNYQASEATANAAIAVEWYKAEAVNALHAQRNPERFGMRSEPVTLIEPILAPNAPTGDPGPKSVRKVKSDVVPKTKKKNPAKRVAGRKVTEPTEEDSE